MSGGNSGTSASQAAAAAVIATAAASSLQKGLGQVQGEKRAAREVRNSATKGANDRAQNPASRQMPFGAAPVPRKPAWAASSPKSLSAPTHGQLSK
eukprot:6137607-Amphidinium_carterae.1